MTLSVVSIDEYGETTIKISLQCRASSYLLCACVRPVSGGTVDTRSPSLATANGGGGYNSTASIESHSNYTNEGDDDQESVEGSGSDGSHDSRDSLDLLVSPSNSRSNSTDAASTGSANKNAEVPSSSAPPQDLCSPSSSNAASTGSAKTSQAWKPKTDLARLVAIIIKYSKGFLTRNKTLHRSQVDGGDKKRVLD